MRKMILIIGSLIFVCGLLYFIYPSGHQFQGIQNINFLKSENQTPQGSILKLSDLAQKKNNFNVSNRTIVSEADPELVLEKSSLKLPEIYKNDGRAYAQFASEDLDRKVEGDLIHFSVGAVGIHRDAIVDRIQFDTKNNVTTWSGHLTDGDKNNEKFKLVRVNANHYMVGSIFTRSGAFEIEAKNGYGWVAPIGGVIDDEH